jgi:hypothetical protein
VSHCEGCGTVPEVYGSSWCAQCHETLPEYTKARLLKFRNACIDAYWARTRKDVDAILGRAIGTADTSSAGAADEATGALMTSAPTSGGAS